MNTDSNDCAKRVIGEMTAIGRSRLRKITRIAIALAWTKVRSGDGRRKDIRESDLMSFVLEIKRG
eukprot:scaffold5145_cov169-Skeletonema_dohrnii-CCMP3373.AAC.1